MEAAKHVPLLFFIFFLYFVSIPHASASPGFAVGPTSLDFGVVEKGGNSTLPVKIYSNENISLRIKANIEWLEIPNRVELNAGESKVINVTIHVPRDAEPGEHRGSINFIPIVEEEPGKAKFVVGKGIDVLVKVPGDIILSEEIINFSNMTIIEGKNAIFKVIVKNTGTVTAFTGASVKADGYEKRTASVRTPVKPNMTQEFRIEYPTKDLSPGNYTCTATVSYDGKTAVKEARLTVKPKPIPSIPKHIPSIPKPLVISVTIVSIAIIAILLWLKKRRKR